MTVFIVNKCPQSVSGRLANFSTKLTPTVYATCANTKVVSSLIDFLTSNKVDFRIATEPIQGIMPVVQSF